MPKTTHTQQVKYCLLPLTIKSNFGTSLHLLIFHSKHHGVMNFKNYVYISWKIQILTILRHKVTQIFTKKIFLLSKFSKLHNLETHFCEFLRLLAPPFQKIKWNPWNLVTTLQKCCFVGPTIFEIPQPNGY